MKKVLKIIGIIIICIVVIGISTFIFNYIRVKNNQNPIFMKYKILSEIDVDI